MGLILGLIKFLIKLLFYFAIFVAIVILIPNLPPYTKFTAIQLEPPQQRSGSLAPNNLLNNAEKLFKDKLEGPEAFQIYNGELYTSLATGEIVKVSPGGHITFVTKIGQPCTGLTQEHKCGRPLGFQVDERTKTLYVADAYYGIWKVDLETDKKHLLVSPQVPIQGKQPKLFNSIVLAENGDLYWTDSSSDFHLKDGAISLLTDPSGRLLHYNAAKNQSKVLLDNLWFPNGVQLSQDKQFLIFAETFRFRLMKYYLHGPKQGRSEVFTAGLPGYPDNVRALPDNSGVLVGLFTVFDDDYPVITRTMAATPLARKFLARLQRLIEIPFELLNNVYPHFLFEEIVYNIGNFRSVSGLVPSLCGLLQLDWNGNIIASYFNTDHSLSFISDAIVYNGKLYTGSPHMQNFIGSVPAPPLLLKAFSTQKVEQPIPKVVQKSEPIKTTRVQDIKSVNQVKLDSEKVVKPVVSQPSSQTPRPAKPTQAPQEKKPNIENKQPLPETSKAGPQTKPNEPTTVKPDMKVIPQLQTKPTPKPETKPTPTPEIKPTPKPETKPTPKPETNPTPKPETKPIPKLETRPTPTSESKPTPKPVTKTTEPETKTTAKPESKPTRKVETKPTLKPETTPTPKPETKPSPKFETKTTPKPATKPTAAKKEINDKREEIKKSNEKLSSKQIPIKEDIPSDTKKPNTETLKVIKKGGPTEIPNPEL